MDAHHPVWSRRTLVAGLAGGLLSSPGAGWAQSAPRIPLVAYMATVPRNVVPEDTWMTFEAGLRGRGYIPGRDVALEYRFADSDPAQVDAVAGEVVALRPDVVVTGNNSGAKALKRRTDSIPIVVAHMNDPVDHGLASSLARPGGNVTGVASQSGNALGGKRVELLKDIVPGLRRVAMLIVVPNQVSAETIDVTRRAADAMNIAIDVVEFRSLDGLDAAFAAILERRPGALLLGGGAGILFQGMRRIVDFTLRNRLPAVYTTRNFAEAGLLVSYGASLSPNYRIAATLVDKILKGAKPGDLPIEQPNTFELVVNMRTAKAIGVKIPQSVLLRADVVIE